MPGLPPSLLAKIRVQGPRCPFCLDAIEHGEPQLACNRCRAWHHQACWSEGRGRCSACRGRETGPQRARARVKPPPQGYVAVDLRLAGLWLGLAAVVVIGNLWVLPAFRRVFAETGLPLPGPSEAVLHSPLPWLVGLAALFLVQLATTTGGATRRQFALVAVWLAGGFLGFSAWALFLPLCHSFSRL